MLSNLDSLSLSLCRAIRRICTSDEFGITPTVSLSSDEARTVSSSQGPVEGGFDTNEDMLMNYPKRDHDIHLQLATIAGSEARGLVSEDILVGACEMMQQADINTKACQETVEYETVLFGGVSGQSNKAQFPTATEVSNTTAVSTLHSEAHVSEPSFDAAFVDYSMSNDSLADLEMEARDDLRSNSPKKEEGFSEQVLGTADWLDVQEALL